MCAKRGSVLDFRQKETMQK